MTTWFPFQGFGCPVSGCTGQKGGYNWNCAQCGTQLFISNTGLISCANGYHSDHISNWQFDCGNHGNHSAKRFMYGDYQGFSYCLSNALDFMNLAGANWVAGLVINIGTQYGRQ